MQSLIPRKLGNSFVALGHETKARFLAPVGQVSFWVALIVGVILLGALGIWVELIKHSQSAVHDDQLTNVRTAIHTFFPALAFTSTMQLILTDSAKYVKSAGYAVGVLLLLMAAGLLFADTRISPGASILLGALASLVSVLIWWVANGYEPMFDDGVPPDASVGGNPDTPLDGNVEGVKT